jgi:hypothetical protein
MNSITVVIQGLCLWLTTAATIEQLGGLPGIVPDFSTATPAHVAVLVIPKTAIVGDLCPARFSASGSDCLFALNGAGLAGGVRIGFASDEQIKIPSPECAFCALPRIQHTKPFTLKPEYTPFSGANIAAQLIIDKGMVRSTWSSACSSKVGDCPRFVEWTLSSTTGNVRLVLSNLRSGTSVEADLKNGAAILVSNDPGMLITSVEKRASMRAQTHLLGSAADWCLYFGMFAGDPACPGKPPIPPPCGSCITATSAKRKAPAKARGSRAQTRVTTMFQTVACSSSGYP